MGLLGLQLLLAPLQFVLGGSVLACLLIAPVLSGLGGVLAYLLAERSFGRPFHSLLDSLRSNRDTIKGGVPDLINPHPAPQLNLVIDEFNGLIKQQQYAARQVKVKQQYLEYAAHHDQLTHLSNRLMFETELRTKVKTALEENQTFSIFLVGLDNFKFFNDQYGHLIGDQMVIEVGSRLKSMMRDIDLVARLDGDEFVVIHSDCPNKSVAETVAQRLMEIVTAPYEYRGFSLKTSVSVGISCFPDDVHASEDPGKLSEEIVNSASVALQDAKLKGKNQYQLFNEAMRSQMTARIRLEQDLKIAMQEEQFEVYYQPKVNLATREVIGAEALIRWNHPKQGRVAPDFFVPVAEEGGLIIELGEWILRTACRQTHSLQEIGYAGLTVAVNISAVQFTDGNLLPMVTKALKDSHLRPELLELEITESAVMHDPEDVIHSLHELNRIGIALAIDDFGTGYSSLSYLKRFPVSTLKIDRAFITNVSSDGDDVAIVETILGLGNHFNMKVVAEGVESQSQLDFLTEQGCDFAQGFLISKPMSMTNYVKWLEQWPYGIQQKTADKSQLPNPSNGSRDNVTSIRSGRRA